MRCPRCKTINPDGEAYCINCDYRLKKKNSDGSIDFIGTMGTISTEKVTVDALENNTGNNDTDYRYMMPAPDADSSQLTDNVTESDSHKYMFIAPSADSALLTANARTSSVFQMYSAPLTDKKTEQPKKKKSFIEMFPSNKKLDAENFNAVAVYTFSDLNEYIETSAKASDFLTHTKKKMKSHYTSSDIFKISEHYNKSAEENPSNKLVCSKCGKDFPDIYRFCLVCGSALVKPQAEIKEIKKLNPDEVLCPHCNCPVPDSFGFCINCGFKLD